MRLIYLSKYFDVPSLSETGSRGFHLCREFSRRGIETTVFATKPPHLFEKARLNKTFNIESYDGLEVIFVRTINFNRRKSLLRVISWFEFEFKVLYFILVNKIKADLIIASSLSLLSVITALFIKRCSNCKVIFEVRDIWPLSIIEQGGISIRHPFIKFLSFVEKKGYQNADFVVGTMPNLEEHVENTCEPHAPVSCVPMGVSEEHEKTVAPSEMNRDSIAVLDFMPKDKFVVGYAGAFGTANALEFLFESARLIDEAEIHFVFVGDGELKEYYIEKYGSLDNVTIGPRLRKQDVGIFLQSCDLLTFATNPASIWKYGHSLNKVVDYMLAAKPILCVFDGYDSMISEAGAGFFVGHESFQKIADEFIRIHSMPCEELAEMGAGGREWLLANRSYVFLAEKYKAIFNLMGF